MSRKKEEDEYGSVENSGWPDETLQGEGTTATGASAENSDLPERNDGSPDGNGDSLDGNDGASVPSTFLAIEEHAKAQRISAPIFAAVRQMQGWSEGKKVAETEFNEAVTAFLGAPVGGKK
jgi:hypothetical protein